MPTPQNPTTLIPDPRERPLLRPSEVAVLLKFSKKTVYHLIQAGELEHIKVRTRTWVPTTALMAYLRLPAAS